MGAQKMTESFNGILDEIYREEVNSLHRNWITNYYNIGHWAIFCILPNQHIVYLSSHPQLSRIYVERNYGYNDCMLTPEMYENWPFYPWRTNNKNSKILKEIHTIREEIFNLNSGTNFVRKIDTEEGRYHLIYCISSPRKDPLMYYIFSCNVNAILEMFDFAYNSLRHVFQVHVTDYSLPKIEKFKPFKGGLDISPYKNYRFCPIQPDINELYNYTKESCSTDDQAAYDLKKQLILINCNSKAKIQKNSKTKLYLVK